MLRHETKKAPASLSGRRNLFRRKMPRRASGLLVATVELVDTARRIHEFLFAGEEGMALGADADLVLGTGGLDMPHLAAGASDDRVTVSGMEILFHSLLPFSVFECCVHKSRLLI